MTDHDDKTLNGLSERPGERSSPQPNEVRPRARDRGREPAPTKDRGREPAPTSEAALLADDPLWYKDAVIYQLHVKAFFDSDDSGIGDFRGLIQKLDYIQSLGVNTLWLLPFYPSPLRDDGYDIADYWGVHPDYGTIDDFHDFVGEAHTRGLRVITELVINHTSDQHPWFQAARRAPPGSPERAFYVWSDTDTMFPETRIIFTDTERSNWAWDPVAEAYYWHRFFSHQPDLNHNNPAVVEAVTDVMRFWFDLGVDGMRLDAIPYLCVREGTSNENLPETHAVLKRMRAVLDEHYRNRCFLAEANQWPEDVRDYFGAGDECHMAYHFPLMPRMYMALAQEDRHPIIEIMAQTPSIPDACQWAIFLRNHDELTLEMVTDAERDYMYRTYATVPRMRVNVGIRRRLAPLLDNSRDKIELMNNLLMTLPGTPIVYYGDELGMGDNIYLGDRDSVRTPMQWNPDRNGGFSRADPGQLYLPPVTSTAYGYQAINVEAQDHLPHSLLNWMRRLIHVRSAHPAWGRGDVEFLHPGNRKVLAYLRRWGDETLLCVANLARDPQPVALDLSRYRGMVPLELSGRTQFPGIGEDHYVLALPGYGFYWFQLTQSQEQPASVLPGSAEPVPVLVWFDGWRSLDQEAAAAERRELAERVASQFRNQALKRWLPLQRWYAGKGAVPRTLSYQRLPAAGAEEAAWTWGQVRVDDDVDYLLPLAVTWPQDGDGGAGGLDPHRIAPVRRQARMGALIDAAADPRFVQALLRDLAAGGECAVGETVIRYRPRPALRDFPAAVSLDDVHRPGEIGTNTTVQIGDWGFLKLYRTLRPGISVEVEMGEFLAEHTGFTHAVPILGSAELAGPEGGVPVAVLQALVRHQGSAWDLVVDHQRRLIQHGDRQGEIRDYLGYLIRLLGQRSGELHQALATVTGDAAFDPEPVNAGDLVAWADGVAREAEESFELLTGRLAGLGGHERQVAERLLAARQDIVGRVRGWRGVTAGLQKTRYHGDYHLGQVLVAEEDFIVIDFEGEPARSIEARRRKHSPLKDVAGMLRSFDYAAFTAAVETLEPSGRSPLDLTLTLGELREWTCDVFLEGYAAVLEDARGTAAARVLELFVWEKAFYELRYELNTRPQWAAIPLHSLERYFLSLAPTAPPTRSGPATRRPSRPSRRARRESP